MHDTNSLSESAETRTSQTMTAIVQTGYGPPHEVLRPERVPVPEIGAGDVLVRVAATSVNTPDWATVTGIPTVLRAQSGLRGPKTPIRGTDVSGVVEAVGPDVRHLVVGDDVFGSVWTDDLAAPVGTFAELAVTPATKLWRKPASVSFEEAAASVMSGLTAMIAICETGRVEPGMRVLVNGASGGVGTFAVQFAKLSGAHVTGVCSAQNAELVRSLGADEIIDHTERSLLDGDERYDVILDNVLNHPPARVARKLTPTGVYLPNSLGTNGGTFARLPRMARTVLLKLRGTDVRMTRCVVDHEHLAELARLLQSGDVRAVIDSIHPLDDAADAVARMLTHRARGNVVIDVPSPLA